MDDGRWTSLDTTGDTRRPFESSIARIAHESLTMRLSLFTPLLIALFAFAVLHVLRLSRSPPDNPDQPVSFHISNSFLASMASVAVVGSTGSVGQATVNTLTKNPAIASVLAITRRPFFSSPSPPLSERVISDLHAIQPSDFRNASVVFCCLGTTRAQAGSAEAFKRDDRDLILTVAGVAKAAGVRSFHLVSSYGADPHAWFLYTKCKGEIEEGVKALGFDTLGIYKPAGLDTSGYPRAEKRAMESVAMGVMGALSPIMGQGRPIKVEHVAEAMVKDALSGRKGIKVFDGSKTIDDFLAQPPPAAAAAAAAAPTAGAPAKTV